MSVARQSPFNEARCLNYDPWEGGKGDDVYRLLSDKILTVRKTGECIICSGQVEPGTRARARTEVAEGRCMTFRFCESCCGAMAISWDDAGAAITERTALGIERANAR